MPFQGNATTTRVQRMNLQSEFALVAPCQHGSGERSRLEVILTRSGASQPPVNAFVLVRCKRKIPSIWLVAGRGCLGFASSHRGPALPGRAARDDCVASPVRCDFAQDGARASLRALPCDGSRWQRPLLSR